MILVYNLPNVSELGILFGSDSFLMVSVNNGGLSVGATPGSPLFIDGSDRCDVVNTGGGGGGDDDE